MPGKNRPKSNLDFKRGREILSDLWEAVVRVSEQKSNVSFVADETIKTDIAASINHGQVAYRYCLPTQLLGKLIDPTLNCLCLQKQTNSQNETNTWDARSLASKIIAPFNNAQEHILGTSDDPYVGNPMRIPCMERDDASKKDVAGWNRLVDVLQKVEQANDPQFTTSVFKQVLYEMWRRQCSHQFEFTIPTRVSLKSTLEVVEQFLKSKSGGDRALAVSGALFDAIGAHFHLYQTVNRARINASDHATDQAADLECIDTEGKIVFVVEVKDRDLELRDVEGTLRKTRRREIKDVFFTAPKVKSRDTGDVFNRTEQAFATGENLYIFNFFELAKPLLALGGESIRRTFLQSVGNHLTTYNTQPSHRKAWKDLLSKL